MTWPTIEPGDLRHQVTILHEVDSSDESGSTVITVPFITDYAKIEVVRGIEVIRSGLETTQLFLTITMYWQAGIFADMQVQALNGLYTIQSVENVLELNVVLKLNCMALRRNA